MVSETWLKPLSELEEIKGGLEFPLEVLIRISPFSDPYSPQSCREGQILSYIIVKSGTFSFYRRKSYSSIYVITMDFNFRHF